LLPQPLIVFKTTEENLKTEAAKPQREPVLRSCASRRPSKQQQGPEEWIRSGKCLTGYRWHKVRNGAAGIRKFSPWL